MFNPELATVMDESEQEQKIEEEKIEKNKISLEFYFSAHETAEDANGLKDKIKDCDIFVPESFGWDNRGKKAIRDLAAGKIKPTGTSPESSFAQVMAESLYNSKKAVVILDVEKDHPKYKEIENENIKAGILLAAEQKSFLQGNFKEAAKCAELLAECHERAMAIRDEILLEKIRAFKKEMEESEEIKKSMQKSGKPELKVLFQLGASHTEVYNELKKDNPDAKRYLSDDILVHPPQEEMRRRKSLGKEIGEDLIANSILQHLLVSCYRKITNNNNKAEWVAREVSKQFSLDDIKQLCSSLSEEKSEDEKVKVMSIFFIEKGAALPESEKEMDKILKRYIGK